MLTSLAAAFLLPASALAFVCSVPVIPLPLGPSNACCQSLALIPGAGAANPTGEEVYWGTKCELRPSLTTNAEAEILKMTKGVRATTKTTISATQEDSEPCPSGQQNACCDPVSLNETAYLVRAQLSRMILCSPSGKPLVVDHAPCLYHPRVVARAVHLYGTSDCVTSKTVYDMLFE